MNCTFDDREELASGYVAGGLGTSEIEAYELHLLSCESCRAAVHEAAALRGALRPRMRRLGTAWVPIGAATAAALAWLLLLPSATQKLGRVAEAPSVAPMPVRTHVDSTSVWAERGIAAYQKADYVTAARWLKHAHDSEPQPGIAFFLGVSLLMNADARDALAAFAAVPDGSPYGGEARYYAAKAWLQLGQSDSARAELELSRGDARIRERASALNDSLDAVK
jgi:hypothetical protein